MTKIKKVFVPIIAALTSAIESNPKAKITDIMEQINDLCSAKTVGGAGGSTFHRNAEGVVVAIFCYYHKLWMDPRVVEFGAKATSPTGFNNMCKEGVSKWTKQNSEAKKAESALLTALSNGELNVSDIPAEQARIQAAAKAIVPREDGYGFDNLEDCLAHSATLNLEVPAA